MSSKYFPWRLFRKFFWALVGLLNLTFLATLGFASAAFGFQLYRQPALVLVLSFFLFSLLGAAFLAYRFASPLRRVILKALRLANKKQTAHFAGFEDEDLFESEPDEYFELEQALDKIRKKMKKRRLELAHEREEAQALMSHLQDAVVSVARDGKINFYNSRFATLFLQQGAYVTIAHVFREPEFLKHLEGSLKGGTVGKFQQKMGTSLEPNGRYFSIVISPLREEKTRDVYGALILFHDISELKKAEQIRIEFVENASHELRTPLTSIKGFLSTAREDLAQGRLEQVPQFLEIISRSVDRLTELTTDLLTISSLEHAKGLRLEMVQPEVITQDVFERLAPLASDKKIMLKMSHESEPFMADAVMVDRVVTNLVGNAIKYIQPGGRIDVHWRSESADGKVILRVKDDGPGIAEEHLDRLFERFYRVDRARNREDGGTGLGLAIVKHIMQSHGGTVRVTSKPGQGAEFVCEFPVNP